jgi:hypothetical protein
MLVDIWVFAVPFYSAALSILHVRGHIVRANARQHAGVTVVGASACPRAVVGSSDQVDGRDTDRECRIKMRIDEDGVCARFR